MKSWEELIPPNDEAREKFFAYLLRKTCTRKQAEEYLSRMNFPESLIDEAEDAGLIDDLSYARLFADGPVSTSTPSWPRRNTSASSLSVTEPMLTSVSWRG